MKFLKKSFANLFVVNLVLFFIWQPVAQSQLIPNRDLGSSTSPTGQKNSYERVAVPSLNEEESKGGMFNQRLQADSNNSDMGTYTRIKVHILGEVQHPGVYVVTVSDRLTDALKFGIPKRSSQRIIQIRHPDEKTRFFDLYRYYYDGDLSHNPFLKDNDVIFVPNHNGVLRIEGPVARPGLYELGYEKNLWQIVSLAGGETTASSKIHAIKVIRFSEGGEKFVLDVENTPAELKKFRIDKGDIIVVPDVINNPDDFDYKVETIPGENHFYPTATPSVFVVGNVSQPGPYPYKSHLLVRDYISYASPSPIANMRNASLIRDGKKRRVKFDDKLKAGDTVMVRGKLNYGLVIGSVSTVLSLALTSLLLENTIRNR